MEKFTTSYNSTEELYNSQLSQIKNIKFTYREVDLLSCIISKKGDKKIASLCNISPRTVSSHVYNIMNKIGYNSKDQIIEFIEFSGKLLLFREYYLHLIVRSYFHKLLAKIGKSNKDPKKIYITRSDEAKYPDLFLSMKKDLLIANFVLESCSEKDSKDFLIIDLENFLGSNYYLESLKLLDNILCVKDSKQNIEDFTKYFRDVQDMYEGRQSLLKVTSPKALTSKKYFGVIITLLIALFSGIFIYNQNYIKDTNLNEKQVIEDFLTLLKTSEITSNNISKENIRKNHSLIKRIEKIVEYYDYPEIKKYLKNAEMESETITNYMHVLQALAAYNMYNRHDGNKAKELLLIAKEVAENYVNTRSNINLNFDDLMPSEILSEMNVVSHMAELYTRILYSLARTHFYIKDKSNIEESRKYFLKAKYLGENLHLFEGYLSEISGILLIDKSEVIKYKKANLSNSEIERIYQIINRYKELRKDSREYILDYNPKSQIQSKIIPSANLYNIICCESFILEMYLILMNSSDSEQFPREFVENIKNYIKPDINFLNNKVPHKKIAGLFNIIGTGLIIMKEKNIVDVQTSEFFKKLLDSNDNDYLQFAEILFEKSVSLSRNSDFTKADALEGLYKVNMLKLEDKELANNQKKQIKEKLQKFKQKKDAINESLKRKTQNISK